MSQHNPELNHLPQPHPDEALQPDSPDFIETPDVTSVDAGDDKFPVWLYLVCGLALFMAGSSFTGFATFGMLDQGPGGPSLAAGAGAKPPELTPAQKGQKIYGNNCANCHQASGAGQPGSYPPLVGSDVVLGNKERLAAVMLHGLQGPLDTKAGAFGTMVMPGWASNFTDEQLADLTTYLRTSWGNTANAVTTEEVSTARAKFASKGGAFTQAELLQIAPNGPDPTDKK